MTKANELLISVDNGCGVDTKVNCDLVVFWYS
jgi:hypothetical protein